MTSIESDERNGEQACTLCGARLSQGGGSPYAFGVDGQLCFECAMARGGRYDAERDAWDPAPDVAGLPDESYGAAPHEQRRRS